MELAISVNVDTITSQEQHLCDTNGESVRVLFSRPARKINEEDTLKMEVTESDVLRILHILLLKRKRDQYNLMIQVKKI